MNSFLSQLRTAVLATLILAAVCCGLYPLAVLGLARALFPRQAAGSLLVASDGTIRGAERIGQPFVGAGYFHPRPSAAGDGYDAANSGGSNLGPTSRRLHDLVRDRVLAYRAENGLGEAEHVPADAVTASGSGLDPHISPRNAELQIPRVARARGLDVGAVRDLVRANTDEPVWGLLGEPGVNVLKLNLALDAR